MPIVNYVREHIRFMEYASDEHLSSSERLVWYALMHIMNQRAQGNIWPDEFIRISNDRLLSFCPMKMDTMAAARNRLKQRGLIDFLNGEKNKKSPAYRMIYFYPQYVGSSSVSEGAATSFMHPSTLQSGDGLPTQDSENCVGRSQHASHGATALPESFGFQGGAAGGCANAQRLRCVQPETERDGSQDSKSNTEKSYYMGDNMGYNFGGNMGDKPGDNPGGNMGDIYNKHIRIQERIQEQETESTTEEDEELERAREETKDAWIRYFGKEPTPGIIDLLAQRSCTCEFGEGVIDHAISVASYRNADSPTDFILTLFCDWRKNGIRNLNDLGEYGFLRDAYMNKHPEIMNWQDARDRLDEFRAKRGVG